MKCSNGERVVVDGADVCWMVFWGEAPKTGQSSAAADARLCENKIEERITKGQGERANDEVQGHARGVGRALKEEAVLVMVGVCLT